MATAARFWMMKNNASFCLICYLASLLSTIIYESEKLCVNALFLSSKPLDENGAALCSKLSLSGPACIS